MKPAPFLPRTLLSLGALALASCAEPDLHSSYLGAQSQGTLVAETRASTGGRTQPAVEDGGEAEGIARRHGRLYYVKNHGATLLRGRQRVTDGLYLERNEDVILSDGRRMKVREGELITRAGDIEDAPNFLR